MHQTLKISTKRPKCVDIAFGSVYNFKRGEKMLKADFDVYVKSVVLAHECMYQSGKTDRRYVNGRRISGFVMSISGKAEYLTENGVLNIDTGDIVYLPESLKYTVSAKDEPFMHYTVNFESEFPDFKSAPGFSVLRAQNCDAAKYKRLFSHICSVWNKKQQGYLLSAKAALYELLADYFCDMARDRNSTKNSAKLALAKAYIDERTDKKITAAEIAAVCGMSVTHLRRSFKEKYGMPMLEYRLDVRMLKAKDMLLSGGYTVSEISEILGFDDANYFSRCFKKKTGVSPKKYGEYS